MELNVKIEVEGDATCGRNCPFLHEDGCLLFNTDLMETTLPDGHKWGDDVDPTMQRCRRCLSFNMTESVRSADMPKKPLTLYEVDNISYKIGSCYSVPANKRINQGNPEVEFRRAQAELIDVYNRGIEHVLAITFEQFKESRERN